MQDSQTHHTLLVSHTKHTDVGTWSCTVEKKANRERVSVSTTIRYEGQCFNCTDFTCILQSKSIAKPNTGQGSTQ